MAKIGNSQPFDRAATSATVVVPGANDDGASANHLALFYGNPAEYLDGVMRFVSAALDAGEPVAIAVPAAGERLLRRRMNGASSRVEMIDMAEVGRNPARIIPVVEGLLAKHRGRRLHFVGEPIWSGRSPEEIREAIKHEALINVTWPAAPILVLCPYDAGSLDPQVLADAERTHPHIVRRGRTIASSAYEGPVIPPGCEAPLPAPPGNAVALRFALAQLPGVRSLVAGHASEAGMAPARASDLVLAVNELATNAIRHAGGRGVLRVWRAGGEVICQVEDSGWIEDPLAGRRIPGLDQENGFGLWLVNQLCELVEVRTGPAGTAVRAHARIG